MGIIGVSANLFYRRQDSITSISISLLISLILNPFIILDTGLQLSYLGTIGIILFCKNIEHLLSKKVNKNIAIILSVSISAQIMIMPITAYKFNSISGVFYISNFFASPILGAIIILGFTTIIVSFISFKLAKLLAVVLNIFLKILNLIASLVSKIPFSSIIVVTPYVISILIIYILVLTLKYIYTMYNSKRIEKKFLKKLKPKNLFKFISIFIIAIIIFRISYYVLVPKPLRIYFVDVEQGDSTLIVTPKNKKILIDGGEGKTDLLFSYLLDRRIKTIDYLIISHFDNDHVGGLFEVMEKLKVKKVIISKQPENSENYQKFKNIIKNKKICVICVGVNLASIQKIRIEKDLYFDILWPNNSKLIEEDSLNNNSIVCKLNYKSFSMLLTGDIEEIAEGEILRKYKNNLKLLNSNVLKVGHHGSKSSSTQEFLTEVKPKIALIGVGENNKFGHPNVEVINRLKDLRMQNI